MIKDLDIKINSAFWNYRAEYANSGNNFNKEKKVTPEMKKYLKQLIKFSNELLKTD